MTKVLVVSSPFPFPPKGANAADRSSGILQFLRLGFEVKLITSILTREETARLKKLSAELGIEITPFMEPIGAEGNFVKRLSRLAGRLAKNPLMLDGAANNFNAAEAKIALDSKMAHWRPDIVWFERSYTWPLYEAVRRRKVPIITRSHNFEPVDFLRSHGNRPQNYPSFLAKLTSELLTIRKSNFIFTVAPEEARMYRKVGAKNVNALPLRNLPNCLTAFRTTAEAKDGMLNVFFTGSTYKVPRNKKTLGFVLREVIPRVEKIAPSSFRFHVFGDKLPQEYQPLFGKNTIYRGYVEDIDGALEDMDIAIGNNLTIAGMQGKIFEPLARGFPLVTSPRGLGGYNDFKEEEHLLFAQSAEDFARQIARLRDTQFRNRIGSAANARSRELFSQKRLDSIVLAGVSKALTDV